ncbi:hypothetical protein LOD99_5821 [Oopsacas minuta]|uniref:VWFA domain-containing protein n=1 Tax=Oopsacas minuta TaxID=111878 RepID=A0AAV7JNL3_9METZ|nr:hypothetical protein LOD99_5821 [Oopsacas minuta]
MREIDRIFSNRFALDFLKSVRQGVIDDQDEFIESEFLHRKVNLSHKSMLLLMEDIISKEINLHPKKEVLDLNNNVVQFICNRNEMTKKIFRTRWEEVAEEVYVEIVRHTKIIFSEQLSGIKKVISNLLDNLSKNSDERLGFDSDSNFEVSDETDRKKFTDTEIKESPCRAMVLYLEKYFDSKLTKEDLFTYFNHDFSIKGVKMIKIQKHWVLCDKSDDDTLALEEHIFNKLTNTKMFNHTEKLFNIYGYLKEFLSTLNCFEYELSKIQFGEFELVKKLKDEYEASALSCPEKCPSCGKLCERELHPHSGKCRIKTGHQICSMGGKVWKNDENRSAILYTCDDYKDSTEVKIPGKKMNWGEFKEQSGNEWDWTLPTDKDYTILQQNNREKMKNIWNKFGKGILKYHANRGTQIEFIPYTSLEEVLKAFQTFKFRICFVIDGTASMHSDIDKARVSVGQLISKYRTQGHGAMFSIVIYRDHCDGGNLIQKFPVELEFTNNHESVQTFLQGVRVFGGGDGPEAVLDGLATAVKGCNWDGKSGTRNIIIHIFDAPPYGDFPNYKSHSNGSDKGNCCCCNHGGLCKFDWKKDVWDKMRKANIEYYGISTGSQFPHFEKTMEDNLGRLFRDVQAVEKEMVNEAVVQIFIDYIVP